MIYLVGIDTLHIGFYVSRFLLSEAERQELEQKKELAKAGVFKNKDGRPIAFRGQDFIIRASGSPPYTYILESDDLTVKIAQRPSKGMFPEVYIEFRSQFLWRYGYKEAFSTISGWVKGWTELMGNVVSRADLCVDVSGKHKLDISLVVSKARKMGERAKLVPIEDGDLIWFDKDAPTFRVGSDSCQMRIYDKTAEIGKSGKGWFRDLWKVQGWDDLMPVSRIEFQLRRDFFNNYGITDLYELNDQLADIYQYLAEDWITIRQQVSDTNRSRWPIADFWQEVQGAYHHFGEANGLLTKRRIHEAMLEHLLPQAAGLMTSVIALSDDGTPEGFVRLAKAYLRGRGTPLEEVVERKRKRKGMI